MNKECFVSNSTGTNPKIRREINQQNSVYSTEPTVIERRNVGLAAKFIVEMKVGVRGSDRYCSFS